MLLQGLVLCMLMTLIGMMVLKWVMARYSITAKVYNSSAAKVRVEGCAYKYISQKINDDLGGGPPPSSCATDSGITINSSLSGNVLTTRGTLD